MLSVWAAGLLMVTTPLGGAAQASNGAAEGDSAGAVSVDTPSVVSYEIDPLAAVVPKGIAHRTPRSLGNCSSPSGTRPVARSASISMP